MPGSTVRVATATVVAVSAVLVSSVSMAFSGYGGGFGSGSSGGSNDGTQYDARGNYATTNERGDSSCTVYRPSELSGGHPIILWGNGTGSRPSSYSGLLEHWASWGFVVIAANTTNAGTGEDMLACLDWAESSSLAASLDFDNVGTSGHSQGGGGAIMAGVDPRITITAPIEGYTLGLGHNTNSHTHQSGPMLLLSGSADTLVSPSLNHGPLIRRTNVPVFWAILSGASHFELVGNGGDFRGIATAWFAYQLQDDPIAATQFEGRVVGTVVIRPGT